MLIGSIFGMVTAVTLGVNNLLTAVATRRFGVLRSTLFTLTLAFLVMIGWAVAIDVPWNIRGDQVLFLGGLGAAAAGSFIGTYMALRLGPVSVVSPISALAGAVTVVYSYLWLGEQPSFLQWSGIAIAVIGAVLASLVIEAGAKVRLVTWGPVFAMFGVLIGAISNAGLKIPIQDGLDSNLTIITQRAFTVLYAALLFFVVTLWRKNRVTEGGGPFAEEGPDRTRLTWKNSWPLIVVGLIDAVSFVSFGYGLANAPAWLIGILSQSGRVIAVIGGVVFFKERLFSYQWAGVILVGVGVALSIVG